MLKSLPSLKIGYVLDGGLQKPDGVQQYILALGEYFKNNNHYVRYIVAGKVPSQYKEAVSLASAITVKSNGNKLFIPLPSKKSRIKEYLAKENFDILHVQTPYSPFMGEKVVLAADKSTAIIGTFHIIPANWFLNFGDYLLGKLSYYSIKKFDKMLSVSKAAAKVAKRDYGLISEVVPNVVDYDRFNKASAKYPKNVVNIVFLGRLVKRKNPITLLKAINYLIENKLVDKTFKVYICGSGENEHSLKDYVINHGIVNLVEFIGFVNEEEKPSVYKSADICVFPSTGGESFGIVLIEAMASGSSVVLAGANPGYSSVLSNFPELLFKPTDYIQLANLLKLYIENNDDRKVKAKALNDYSKSFDVNIVGNHILEIYRTALRKHTKE